MTKKTILVLVDTIRPNEGGSNLFDNIIKLNKDKKEIVIFSEINFGIYKNFLIKLYLNRYFRFLKNRYAIFCKLFLSLIYNELLSLLANDLYRKHKNKEIKGILCRSNDIQPILAAILAKKFKCKLHISVFDIPFTYNIYKNEIKLIKKNLKIWINQAESFDFASKGMRNYLKTLLTSEKKNIIIWSSAGKKVTSPPSLNIKKNISSIAFCGSLRFFEEFKAMSEAIHIINYTHKRDISIKLFGTKALKLPYVQFKGYIDNEDELIQEIRNCDLAYSPLSFQKQNRILVETSFPGKIETYLTAGVPILAHAPSYASNYKFVVDNQVGIGIETLKPKDIAEKIIDYEKRWDIRKMHSENSIAVLKKHFDTELRATFFNNLFK